MQGMAIAHVREVSTLVGPRMAASAGDPKAVAWAVDKMKALGLANVRAEPVTVPRWERGDGHAELLGATERPLAVAALGGSVGTPPAGIEAEVVSVASIDALGALADDQVRGKIVFYDVVMERTMGVDGYARAVGVRFGGAAAAAQKGAVASIVRSISTSTSNFPHTGQMNAAAIPGAAISVADAVVLEGALAAGTVRVRLTLGCASNGTAPSSNVIGEVVGREAPDDIVLLGAHLDSWDLGTGALDDGAGLAMVLEAGRLLARTPEGTLRTVRIVLFANEEDGLSGANAYASAHQAELARHAIALESDLGDGRPYGVTFLAGSAASAVMPDLMAPLAPLGVAAPTAGGDYGADLGPLRRQGVPVADILQDATTYFDYHHSAADKIENVDEAALTQATAAVAVFAYQMARSTVDLGRAPITTSISDEH
jgi:Zn-dependent M28 family amino/carboxypeptidase